MGWHSCVNSAPPLTGYANILLLALQVTNCTVHTFDCTYDGASRSPERHFYHKIWCETGETGMGQG